MSLTGNTAAQAVEDINNELLRELPKYHTEMFESAMEQNPLRGLWAYEPWEDGDASNDFISFRGQRLDDDPSEWEQSEEPECKGRSCDWRYKQVEIGQQRQKAVLVRRGLRSPTLCLEKLRDKAYRMSIVQGYLETLKNNVIGTEADYLRHAFGRMSPNLILNNDLSRAHGEFPVSAIPQYTLSTLFFETLYGEMKKNDANLSPIGRAGNAKLHAMFMSEEMLNQLTVHDSTFREQMLEVDPNSLNVPVGSVGTKRVGNFILSSIEYPRRYRFNQARGELEQVQPWIDNNGFEGGVESLPNPEYHDVRTAPYEEILIPNRRSMTVKAPRELTNFGAGFVYNAQNYSGSVEWHNVQDNASNPEGNKGWMKAKLELAAAPKFPNRGIRLLVQRMQLDWRKVGLPNLDLGATIVSTRRHPIRERGAAQGSNDVTLYLSFKDALPAGVTDYNVVFLEDDIKEATLTSSAATATDPYRYLFTFDAAVTPACFGGPLAVVEKVDETSGATTCSNNCVTCPDGTPLTCASAAAPAGYASALDISAAGLTAVAGDPVVVNFGQGGTRTGTVISYSDPTLQVAFENVVVTCSTGDGVLGVEVTPAYTETPTYCFTFSDADGAQITGWTDGTYSVGLPVDIAASYSVIASDLNESVGATLFEAVAGGVKYLGTETPAGNLGTFEVDTVVDTVTAAECA